MPFGSTAPDTPIAERRWIGAALTRREDEALLCGRGRYVDDIGPPGCLHAVFVRSPYARARLLRVDASRAERMPGVRLILTGAMIESNASLPVNPIIEGIRRFESPILALDRVNHVGAPVALVVADDLASARDAAEAVELDCEPLAALVDISDARDGDSLLAGWPDNVAFEKRWRDGDVASAFAHAHRVVDIVIDCPRVAPAPLETRGLVAAWREGRLTVWIPSQSPHRAREHLALLLGLDVEAVRTIAPDVGGAFGGKASLYPEDVAIAHAAMRLSRPVKWIATRNEDMISASHGRGSRIEASAGFDVNGKLLALRADVECALGSWGTFSAVVPAINAARILPGPYRVDAIDVRARGYVTNTAPIGIYRGAGRPEAALVIERVMETAARAFDLDASEIRRRNLVPAASMPYRTATGQTLDSGSYSELLDRALAMASYESLRAEQARRRARGELVGIGINLYVEPCGSGWESARITRNSDGRFVVASGSTAQGQGHRTAYAQVAAAVLDVPIEHVEVVQGDSASSPRGVGALASRSMAIGGSAVKAAAEKMKDELAARAHGSVESIVTEMVYTAAGEAWSAGCCVVAVHIDPDTGVLAVENVVWVDDAGVIVNPLLAHGQLEGGFTQGLGQTLMERIHYDADGQINTGSLMDYALPRAADIPSSMTLVNFPSVTNANSLGAKGVGESGCIAAPAAILNAAIDALAPLGVTDLVLPLTSETLWRAIIKARFSNERTADS
ncbi:MAG TPA: xanthine dehydrogenase family protein molybdopterin-binding subunit [Casimicrobiaceae bacterium]|nr:xanthine dehydrogenase family protein molybdopterin-binding subunit [Casimicrobiaceae bacterium]